ADTPAPALPASCQGGGTTPIGSKCSRTKCGVLARLRSHEEHQHAGEKARDAGVSELAHLLANLADGLLLQLTNPLARQVVLVANLLERQLILVVEPEAPADDARLDWSERPQQAAYLLGPFLVGEAVVWRDAVVLDGEAYDTPAIIVAHRPDRSEGRVPVQCFDLVELLPRSGCLILE